jgi:hypothetical protein
VDVDTSNDPAQTAIIDQLSTIVAEAKRGNAEVLPRLWQLLDDHPEVWRHYGGLDAHVTAKWLDLLAGDNACVRESLSRQLSELRAKLNEPDDSPLVKLLIARVTTSWLMVGYFDAAVALATGDVPAAQARFMDQQLHRAEKRHSEAIKALAEVRKLLPVVQ